MKSIPFHDLEVGRDFVLGVNKYRKTRVGSSCMCPECGNHHLAANAYNLEDAKPILIGGNTWVLPVEAPKA